MFNFLKKDKNTVKTLIAPVDGKILDLSEVEDPVFSQKMMGEGIAVIPEDNTIVAPADGKIVLIPETRHAFGMKLADGMELLVHVGLDTVSLGGEGFTALVNINDEVKAGTPILKVDTDFVKSKGISLTTPLIIMNHGEYELTAFHTEGNAKAGETVLIEYMSK